MILEDTIVALATPQGVGAVGIIRLSGAKAIAIAESVFTGKKLSAQASHTIHYGHIVEGEKILDEVMVSLFKAPKSFTTEDVIEITCHGSPFILKEIIQLLIAKGARMAQAGEFTKRAFLNGRIDLSQAEAVADLIAAESEAQQQIALKQIKGGLSDEIKKLREELVNFASLIELELDFAEEDVEFADRLQLESLIQKIIEHISPILESFKYGNAVKNGIPVTIAGKPNAGKSTLLNALLKEERAIVSEIAGTTRDSIEDEIVIEGITFRFIDTAGLRHTEDVIEKIGVEKSYEKIKSAAILLYLFDASLNEYAEESKTAETFGIPYLLLGNKIDMCSQAVVDELSKIETVHVLSAKNKNGIEELKTKLLQLVAKNFTSQSSTIVTNARHFESLKTAKESLEAVLEGLSQHITGDFLSLDIKRSLNALGEITGEITNDEILGTIFGKFCIGK